MPRSKTYHQKLSEAQKAYKQWKTSDPFPDIESALLNSADIDDYIRETGMIYPYYKEDLSAATYSVRLKGLVVTYRQELGTDKVEEDKFFIGKDDSEMPVPAGSDSCEVKGCLKLAPNSITFLTLEPMFQVPDYMVLRFNLKIPHIYKGLLLGTGPIIDPGFQGRLSIPLHNLTSNEYTFFPDDEIISLEFTKLSPNDLWKNTNHASRKAEYKSNTFNPDRSVDVYLRKALEKTDQKTVVSSVISATNDAKKTANEAKKVATEASKRVQNLALCGVMAIVIALVALIFPTLQLVKSSTDTQENYAREIAILNQEIIELQEQIEDLCKE